MRAWFDNRTRSEKLVLSLGTLVVAGALYFLVLVEPLQLANARLATRIGAQVELQRHLTALQAEVAQLRATVDTHVSFPAGSSLLSVVTTSARDAGIQQYTRKMTPAGANAITLVLEDVPFKALSAWLVALDQQSGVAIDRINIESTPAPGVVSSQMTLQARLAAPAP